MAESKTLPLPQPTSTKVKPSACKDARRIDRLNVDQGQVSYAMPFSRFTLVISNFSAAAPTQVSTPCKASKTTPTPRLAHHASRACKLLLGLVVHISAGSASLRRISNRL